MNDFEDAAFRHFDSASLLAAEGHDANASHLLGFCAECVLKALIFQTQKDVEVPQATRKHITNLWGHFYNHPAVASFPLRISKARIYEHHFSGWDVDQRYWGRRQFSMCSIDVSKQTKGAKGLLGILDLAKRGLI